MSTLDCAQTVCVLALCILLQHQETLEYLKGVASTAGVAVNETALEVARMRHELSDYDKDDSDDMILQYNPEQAAAATADVEPTTTNASRDDGTTHRQRVLQQRQAAKRAAKQLLGDSDRSDDGAPDAADGVSARSRIAFSLADIARTHTRGYRGRLGAPARHGTVADIDASDSGPDGAPPPQHHGTSAGARSAARDDAAAGVERTAENGDHAVAQEHMGRRDRRALVERRRYAQLAAWESASEYARHAGGIDEHVEATVFVSIAVLFRLIWVHGRESTSAYFCAEVWNCDTLHLGDCPCANKSTWCTQRASN